MHPLCSTRAVKVLKYLHRTVPDTVPRSSLDALERLPSSLLTGLRTAADWGKVTEDAQLKRWLADNPIPSARAKVSGPLFHGTLVFAQVSFAAPDLAPSGISAADTQTAINYAALAGCGKTREFGDDFRVHRLDARYGCDRGAIGMHRIGVFAPLGGIGAEFGHGYAAAPNSLGRRTRL